MDRIPPSPASGLPGPARPSLSGPVLPTLPPKVGADYARAVRRRIWLVVAVALPVGVAGALLVARQRDVYQASADIRIDPPQYDPALAQIVPQSVGHHNPDLLEKYVPNRLVLLQSKALVDSVAADPTFANDPSGGELFPEFQGKLKTRQLTGTTTFLVTLDGHNPARVAKLLNTLLDVFAKSARDELTETVDKSKDLAHRNIAKLRDELKAVDDKITKGLKGSTSIAPGGKNLLQEKYLAKTALLAQMQAQHVNLMQEAWLNQMYPNARGATSPHDARLAQLQAEKHRLERSLKGAIRLARDPDGDPAAIYLRDRLRFVLDDIKRLRGQGTEPTMNLTEISLAASAQKVQDMERQVQAALGELQRSMPEFQEHLSLLTNREGTFDRIATMQARLADFEALAETLRDPVTILHYAVQPTAPVSPNRPLLITLLAIVGVALGVGLVCLLEMADQTVKVPEQLTHGLGLPLFGVVPRVRRTAQISRGGHLWTPGAPTSVEADAYRNLRASLLGVSGPGGPIVTLLVTSAKAGEGKSTTALNLAATCARAGERTLLMDVDLRRPSLAEVFHDDEPPRLGLVDILKGDVLWQRTVVRTDTPNLDFLPTGDPTGVPIEVLGTLELRQLVTALSRHYDRVILDGPAVLGMADCRMLGRIVDAAVLVVRSGAQGLPPLLRAKAMLEQSHVVLAGVVFNGLYEDLKNWSSYGSLPGYTSPWGETPGRGPGSVRGLEAPSPDPSVFATAGSGGV